MFRMRDLSSRLRDWSDELRSIADEGLLFDPDHPYHPPRYKRVRRLAAEMFAAQSGEDDDSVEAFFTTNHMHITPYVGADAAIFDDDGRILLIQRRDTSLWAMPGGAIEVGETPAEAASRETHEETGLVVEPLALLGVYDSRRCGTLAPVHLYHIVFACGLKDGATPQVSVETLAVDWFAEDALPPLHAGHQIRVPDAFAWHHGELQDAFFDR